MTVSKLSEAQIIQYLDRFDCYHKQQENIALEKTRLETFTRTSGLMAGFSEELDNDYIQTKTKQ